MNWTLSLDAKQAFGRAKINKWSSFAINFPLEAGEKKNGISAVEKVEVVLSGSRALRCGGLAFPVKVGGTDWVISIASSW